MTELSEEDRRQGDRRGEERREFRRAVGRRDPEGVERRGKRKRYRGLLIALFLLVALFFGRRTLLVGPTRLAEAEAESARLAVAPILVGVRLPLLSGPGFGPPVAGDPTSNLVGVITAAEREELRRIDVRMTPALEAAPGVAAVPELLAPIRFLLGRERDARRTWETLLRVGDERQEGRARIGLALTAVRSGFRATEEQDAWFAFEQAESHLARIGADHPDVAEAVVLGALVEALRTGPGIAVDLGDVAGLGSKERALLEAEVPGISRRWTESARPPTIEKP